MDMILGESCRLPKSRLSPSLMGMITKHLTCAGVMRQSLTKNRGKNLTVMPDPSAKHTEDVKRTYGTAQAWRLIG